MFIFPTFKDWVINEFEAKLKLGEYCCEIRAFSWGQNSTTYAFGVSLADRNPLNIYTRTIFYKVFEFEGDLEKLKYWYENVIIEFNAFWENYIKTTYLSEE